MKYTAIGVVQSKNTAFTESNIIVTFVVTMDTWLLVKLFLLVSSILFFSIVLLMLDIFLS
jgi:hypothetical protein